MERYAAFILAYLLGSIPFAYFAGKIKKLDIREHGSGNMGTTNAFRLLGTKLGVAVLVGDVCKGAAAAALGYWILEPSGYGSWGGIAGGLLAMAGHSWNPFFGFRPSGKGVASGFGILVILMPEVSLLSVSLFVLMIVLTRYVSLGSLVGALSVPIAAILWGEPLAYQLFGFAAAALVVFRHWANFQRILNGTEHRFGEKKNSQTRRGAGRNQHRTSR